MIDTTGNTPWEIVWKDGSLEVVGPSVKEELDFLENILDHQMDAINLSTNEVQF